METSFGRGVKSTILFIIGAVAILAINVPIVNLAVKNAAYSVLQPLQSHVWIFGANVYGFFEPLIKAGSLADENEHLRDEIENLLVKDTQTQDLKKENEILRQGLNLELQKEFDLKLGTIIAKDIARDVLMIDKGSKDMIEVGMPVITSQKAIVGKISKVYDSFSEITLVSEKNFSFDVKVGEENIDGLIKGQGGLNAYLDLVPKDKNIKINDPIFTSAMGGIFPAGLLVGQIKEVNKNDVKIFQSALVSLAFDINGSQKVFIASVKTPF